MSAALEVSVARRIGTFDLDVSFSVESGTSVLFGPSGSGKSLTLGIIAGLVPPDRGSVVIGGRVVTDSAARVALSPQSRRIGMVFQDGLLLPHRSVLDNVALAVRQSRSRSERRQVAHGWLERVGAPELADRRPTSLSGGQRQRVALARGLAGDPSVVLLDEPLSALDASVRAELREVIREVLTASGVPAVLVTHDAEEAEELGDVIIAYANGRVVGRRTVLRSGKSRLRSEHDQGPATP